MSSNPHKDKNQTDKVIFLDIDGVLSTAFTDAITGNINELSRERVAAINTLADISGAKVVLATTRYKTGHKFEVEDTITPLLKAGFDPKHFHDDITAITRHGKKQPQIREWLANHPEVTTHVVIDDELKSGKDLVIITPRTNDGLLYADLKKAAEIFGVTMNDFYCYHRDRNSEHGCSDIKTDENDPKLTPKT